MSVSTAMRIYVMLKLSFRILILGSLYWHIISVLFLTNSMELSPFERPPVPQLLKNLYIFYRTRRFIAVFTKALHWSLSCANSIQYIPPHTSSLGYILIISSYFRLGRPSGLSFCYKVKLSLCLTN
jgi:hypothetical protein